MNTQDVNKLEAANYHTLKHIHAVAKLLHSMASDLLSRADKHDASKLESPEAELLAEHTHKLSSLGYGTQEYNDCRELLKPALEHHYANNRHHPEHFKNGINDMNLIDLIEMFCDWKASSSRHNNGNIRKSIDHNVSRFSIDKQLEQILRNTADYVDD